EVERKGLEALQGDIKQRIATLRRAECLRKQHKKKEQTRTAFYRDPYKFVKDLFVKEKTGTLKVPLRELEKHLRKTYSDNQRHVPASIPDDMPPIQPPEHQLEVRPPTWSEVESTVKRARTASAPGPNGVPYRLYKNAPGVLKYLWKLMKVAWEKGIIPKAWRRAPHEILWTAFKFFQVPEGITRLVKAYFQDLQFCVTAQASTTAWQHLEIGDKLQGNIKWARMEIKPSKSRSISIVKGQLTNERFQVNNEPIPTVLEKPIKSLGRWYSAELKDSKQVEQLRQDTISGLKKINNTALPGKLKLWCFQFGLLPCLMWPISIYEVTLSHASRLERLATGRKWKPSAAVAAAKAALRHRDIVGHVQHGRGGLGLEAATPTWQKATPTERRHMVVEEVRHQEEAARCAKAVSQAQQGRWMKWDGVERRKITWSEMWGMEANRLSFIIRATYDVLPSPTNLHLWYGEDPACPQCAAPATLKHILVGCKTSLTQGRYTWRHNQVLRCLADELENKRVTTNATPLNAQTTIPRRTTFMREGEKQRTKPSFPNSGPLNAARDWEMRVDLNQRLTFPPEIAATNLRPDLVLWSKSCRRVFIVEMTVPWEDAIDEAFERKRLRYANLAAEAEGRGWNVKVWPVEVGCRGFVASSTTRLLKEVGIRGQSQRRAIKELATAAERSSHWLWLKRWDATWAAK
ncbi:hypothetical protein PO909_000474, partial [Leuciscus waleckii]